MFSTYIYIFAAHGRIKIPNYCASWNKNVSMLKTLLVCWWYSMPLHL